MFGQSDSCSGATVFSVRRKRLGEEQESSSFRRCGPRMIVATDEEVRRTAEKSNRKTGDSRYGNGRPTCKRIMKKGT
jgi:hypothetical protein